MLRLAAIAVSLPLLALAGEDDIARYLHPDAKFLMGIEMKRIAASSAARIVQKQFPHPASLSGFDPLRDVTRIVVSSPGQAKTGPAYDETPFLIVVAGQFDLQKLMEMAVAEGEMVARYGSVELITPPHGKTTSMHLGLLSPNLLLAGDAVSVREAIDRNMLPASGTINAPLRKRAAALAAGTDIWMTSTISPAELGAGRAPGLGMFSDVRSMDMAVSLERGLGFQLTLNTRSRATAGKLAGAILALTQFAPAKGPDAEVLKALAVKNEGAAVTVSLAIDAAALEKGIAQIQRSVEPRAAASKQPPPPPQRRVIRIVGAESGPTEIPFDPPSP